MIIEIFSWIFYIRNLLNKVKESQFIIFCMYLIHSCPSLYASPICIFKYYVILQNVRKGQLLSFQNVQNFGIISSNFPAAAINSTQQKISEYNLIRIISCNAIRHHDIPKQVVIVIPTSSYSRCHH